MSAASERTPLRSDVGAPLPSCRGLVLFRLHLGVVMGAAGRVELNFLVSTVAGKSCGVRARPIPRTFRVSQPSSVSIGGYLAGGVLCV